MSDLGYISLILGLVIALYGVVVSLLGAFRRMPELVTSGRNALYTVGGLVLLAAALLWRALLTDQFSLEYVVTHTERNLPVFYKFSAMWGGQAGSLLFWTLILCGFAAAATWFFRNQNESMKPFVNAVLLVNIAFFLMVVLFAANPFERLWRGTSGSIVTAVFQPAGTTAVVPADGQGLNPQLQNYWMVIHPVALYLGFIGMTVPFAFAVGALVTGRLGNGWIRLIRKWALIPWLFLTVGILLGSQWAYIELGWGGYWAWDPVENASFLPFLTATAFIHSIMIQERRGMLKVWNMVLIWLTWELTLFGTFLTRSGVVESVHSFAMSPIGPMFAGFIFLSMVGFLALLVWRLPLLRNENQLDDVFSRETVFLTQNIVFLVITFATMMGTLFRPLSEWIVGERISLNEPYFERVNGPIFAFLLILMGAAPLLAWRRSGPETLRRNFGIPLGAAIASLPFIYLTGTRILAGYVGIAVLVFVLAGIIQEYVRGVRARRITSGENVPQAILSLLRRNGRRYGGYIVHLGVLMIALGIIGNEFYQSEGQANLRTGETINVSNYALTYRGMDMNRGPNYNEFSARIDVQRNGANFGQLVARQHIYTKNQEQPMTEVGLRPGLMEDVYVVLAGWEDSGRTASFKVYVNPLMTWMWIGGLMMILGVVFSAWPRGVGVTVEARAKAPAGAEPAN